VTRINVKQCIKDNRLYYSPAAPSRHCCKVLLRDTIAEDVGFPEACPRDWLLRLWDIAIFEAKTNKN